MDFFTDDIAFSGSWDLELEKGDSFEVDFYITRRDNGEPVSLANYSIEWSLYNTVTDIEAIYTASLGSEITKDDNAGLITLKIPSSTIENFEFIRAWHELYLFTDPNIKERWFKGWVKLIHY